jgi:hypothetical protein
MMNCDRTLLVGAIVLGSVLAAPPAPTVAELYTVDDDAVGE